MSSSTFSSSRFVRLCAPILLVAGILAACSSTDDPATQADAVRVTDQWAKAAQSEMTAVFATVTNGSDAAVRIVGGTTQSAERVELHEMAEVDGTRVMRPIEGGLTVPAHGSTVLRPGGDHIMLMGLRGPIRAGDEVRVTLNCTDGSTVVVVARARDFHGNQENYQPHASAPAHG
ncbi:copper chaperone PCu(A)C [Gordonia sp. ABSL1-1]|uniref:copper chaperone PCu(A)C n=1 Tax=Gordonia sp. ABSL1-1 TaxID=3053923 RepID=UPI0025734B36|nr:copper chaperone PCu(A)C [Gordonia sp. ABSL1-1]MDL9938488.1 copper chaperone PCu(A)C [Gordonia sp. ABSL1-1]